MLIVQNPDLLRRMSAPPVVALAARNMKPWPIRGGGLGQSILQSLFSSSPSLPNVNAQGVVVQATQAQLNQALAAAQKNGVDPGSIVELYNSGADGVQLMLVATAGVGPATMQSQLNTINKSVGASNYAGQYGVPLIPGIASPAATGSPTTSWLSTNWPWLVGAGAAAIAGAYLLGRLL